MPEHSEHSKMFVNKYNEKRIEVEPSTVDYPIVVKMIGFWHSTAELSKHRKLLHRARSARIEYKQSGCAQLEGGLELSEVVKQGFLQVTMILMVW